jgi:type I restriction enzyme S subunit
MKLERFFEKFDQLADAPNAVAMVREIILRKAVSGGLSGSLSSQWKTVKVEHLTEIQNGFAFKSNGFNQAGHGMPLVRIRDLASETTEAFYTGEYREEFVVKKGDFLIGMDGNFNIHRWNGPDALLNQRVCRLLNFTADISADFLFLAIQEHLDEIHRNTTFTTVKHISAKQIREIAFPLPPLAEQKRIVAKVDELMALCDRLEAQQQERDTRHAALARASLARFAEAPTPANLDCLFHNAYTITPTDLRKTILTLAMQGKLVPQDPNVEPAGDVLRRSHSNSADIVSRRGVADISDFTVDADQSPYEVPLGWEWCRLGYLNPTFQNGASSRGDRDGEPVVVLRLADIVKRRISLENTRELKIEPNQIAKYLLREGDILITRVNGSADIVGRFVLVESDLNAIYCDHFIRMRINGDIADAQYLELLGATELVRNQIAGLFITTAGQKTVNQGHISSLLIALPPLAEQHRIVAKVDQLMAWVAQLETQLAASRATAEKLMEAVVAELTAQELTYA